MQACHYLIRQQNQRIRILLLYSMQVHYPIVACYSMQVHYPIVACYCHTATFLIIDYQAFCVVKVYFPAFGHSDSI